MAASVDLSRYANLWSEQDKTLFNQMPIQLTKLSVDVMKFYARWPKLLNSINWTPNSGTTMQGIREELQPILRGQVLPNAMITTPKKDVIETRETGEKVQLYRQDFETNLLHWMPSFYDLYNHVEAHNRSLTEQITVYGDLFYRTAIFHGAPKVWLCGKASGTELTATPYWTSPTIALSKDQNNLQQMVAQVTEPLKLTTIKKLATIAYNDVAMDPFSGRMLPDGTDGKALAYKYCLLCGSEVWDGFHNDAAASNYKALDLDLLTDGFQGNLFGRITSMFERFELRIAADGTIPAPETTEENPVAYNYGERVMNPDYVNAPIGVAFLIGGEAYKSVKVGPPPMNWTDMTMKKFAAMDWNGKVNITQNVLVPGRDGNNNIVFDTNKRGEYLQLVASLALGTVPIRRRNIIPILYVRRTNIM